MRALRGKSIYLPWSASSICLYSLAFGPFFPLQISSFQSLLLSLFTLPQGTFQIAPWFRHFLFLNIVYGLEILKKCKLIQCYFYPTIIIFQRLYVDGRRYWGWGHMLQKFCKLASYLSNSTANYDQALPCACIWNLTSRQFISVLLLLFQYNLLLSPNCALSLVKDWRKTISSFFLSASQFKA